MARVFRLRNTSKASIKLDEDQVTITGDKDHFMLANGQGIVIQGPVSFVSGSHQRRTGGLFVGINDFSEMIPQTIFTPVPSKIPMPPIFAVQNIVKDLAFFMALMV